MSSSTPPSKNVDFSPKRFIHLSIHNIYHSKNVHRNFKLCNWCCNIDVQVLRNPEQAVKTDWWETSHKGFLAENEQISQWNVDFSTGKFNDKSETQCYCFFIEEKENRRQKKSFHLQPKFMRLYFFSVCIFSMFELIPQRNEGVIWDPNRALADDTPLLELFRCFSLKRKACFNTAQQKNIRQIQRQYLRYHEDAPALGRLRNCLSNRPSLFLI